MKNIIDILTKLIVRSFYLLCLAVAFGGWLIIPIIMIFGVVGLVAWSWLYRAVAIWLLGIVLSAILKILIDNSEI